MSEKKNLVCIVCPQGCSLEIDMEGTSIGNISGYRCRRGSEYARQECINPVRTITSTVKVMSGRLNVAPVKSDKPIPKNLILSCMKEINRCTLHAPVRIGDIAIENILDTGANIIVTSNIKRGEATIVGPRL